MIPVASEKGDLVVLGIGNPILGDDGAGIHALQRLERQASLPARTRLVDGGTAGPDLLEAVRGCSRLLVLDAVDVGGTPGDVIRLELDSPLAVGRPFTVHELGLATLLDDLRLLGELPASPILLGIQPGKIALGTALSPEVERGLEILIREVFGELRRWAVHRRPERNPAMNRQAEREP